MSFFVDLLISVGIGIETGLRYVLPWALGVWALAEVLRARGIF